MHVFKNFCTPNAQHQFHFLPFFCLFDRKIVYALRLRRNAQSDIYRVHMVQ